jgi:predicted lipoprotein with Yx(FWY)xxD motif
MTRYLILFPLIACTVSPASAQSAGNQPDASSVQQDAPQQTVIGDYLSLGIDGPRGREFLFGYTGMPVYTYSRDKGAQPTCYDECAVRWPPYIVGAHDDLGPKQGVEGKVGTTKRSDGNLQLTYNGRPLYFYAADKEGKPPAGHRVNGLWHLVRP